MPRPSRPYSPNVVSREVRPRETSVDTSKPASDRRVKTGQRGRGVETGSSLSRRALLGQVGRPGRVAPLRGGPGADGAPRPPTPTRCSSICTKPSPAAASARRRGAARPVRPRSPRCRRTRRARRSRRHALSRHADHRGLRRVPARRAAAAGADQARGAGRRRSASRRSSGSPSRPPAITRSLWSPRHAPGPRPSAPLVSRARDTGRPRRPPGPSPRGPRWR
jgi:hypothetical protein